MDQRPSRLAAGLAATLPLVCLGIALVVLIGEAEGPAGFLRMLEEAGALGFLVVSTSALAAVGAGVLLACAGFGLRVPSAATVAVSGLPWVLGATAMLINLTRVRAALEFAAPEQRAALMAAGIAEASSARLLGTVLGGALLAGTALGLGTCALGQRAPGRSVMGAIVGAGTGLALVVAAVVTVALGEIGAAAVLFVLPALAGLLALTLAGAGAGADAPHGRSAAMAASTPVAAGLAFVAGAAAASTLATIMVFGALGAVDPGSRTQLLVQAAAEIAPASALERWGFIAALVPAFALAFWSLSRVRANGGRILGAVALVLVAALVVLVDAHAVGSARDDLAAATSVPWDRSPGFRPIAITGEPAEAEVDAVVTLEGIVARSGGAAPLSSANAIFAERVRAQTARRGQPEEIEAPPEEPGPSAGGPEDRPSPEQIAGILGVLSADPQLRGGSPALDGPETPTLDLAIDERLPAASLRMVFEAAGRAGARSVRLVGVAPGASDEDVGRMRAAVPLLAPFAVVPRSRVVLLERWLPAGAADEDARLLHARVTASGAATVLLPRAGGGEPLRLTEAAVDDLERQAVGFGERHTDLAYLRHRTGCDRGVVRSW